MGMRIAVLVKQVPRFEAMELGPDGRLRREGLELELNPYCRRAVSKGVELAQASAGTCVVLTLGPPAAAAALKEAVAWGEERGVPAAGVLVSDPAFAGSDTYATARALAAALTKEGPFDLILAGRNSVDADTGQVGPEVAELLDLPMLGGVRELRVAGGELQARCEHDDGWTQAVVALPALITCAERLCEPAKVDADVWRAVADERIRMMTAADLGPGPWGQAGSPTWVGDVRVLEAARRRVVLDGAPGQQVTEAIALLHDLGALAANAGGTPQPSSQVPMVDRAAARDGDGRPGPGEGRTIAVVLEPQRPRVGRDLLGAAARLAVTDRATGPNGRVVAFGSALPSEADASSWGADVLVELRGSDIEEDIAAALAGWCLEVQPWAVLVPGTMWGREVASRLAARLGAGLTGDAVDVDVDDDRLVAWKPAFGGRLVAAIHATSPVQMVTVRPGMLALAEPRASTPIPVEGLAVAARGRVRRLAAGRDDELDELMRAEVVVGVGTGVAPDEYGELRPLLDALGAEMAATRKVTDKGWLPRSRQVGITGRSISPRLYVAVGIAGKFNHVVGVRGAGAVLAVNCDRDAGIFEHADVGIVGDWHEVVPLLVDGLCVTEDRRARA